MFRRILIVALGLLVASEARASILYGVNFPTAGTLYSVDPSSGALSSIGLTGLDSIGDLTSDTRAGSFTLWGIRIASNQLVTFDATTGAGTLGPSVNIEGPITSLAFDPVTGLLYGNTTVGFGGGPDKLYSIDPVTGNATFVGVIGFDNVFALGFDQAGALFGVSDSTDQLIGISTLTGAGTLIGSTGLGFVFDIASRPEDGVMFAADSGTSSLYRIDLGTGATTLVGPYGSATNVVGLAFSPGAAVPEPATLTLLGGALSALALRRRLRRKSD